MKKYYLVREGNGGGTATPIDAKTLEEAKIKALVKLGAGDGASIAHADSRDFTEYLGFFWPEPDVCDEYVTLSWISIDDIDDPDAKKPGGMPEGMEDGFWAFYDNLEQAFDGWSYRRDGTKENIGFDGWH